MPLSKEREAERKRISRVQPESENVQPKLLTRPNRLGSNGLPEMVENEYNPDERLQDGRLRYLGPFHDGQVLDRLSV